MVASNPNSWLGTNSEKYRTKKEFLRWKKKDPIQKYQKKLLKNNEITEEEIKKIEKNLFKKINQAYEYAESSPYPKPSEAFNYIYAK